MKSKLIAVFLAPAFGSALMTPDGTLPRAPSYQTPQSLAISQYGTLSEIFDANGNSRFGKLTNNGFQVSYRSKGKTTSVSATGDDNVTGLLPGQVQIDGNSMTVTVTTSDRALEITSYFIYNAESEKLIVHRKFKNISTAPVVLQAMREYVDPILRNKTRAGRTPRPIDCRIGDCTEPPPPCRFIQCPLQLGFLPPQLTTTAEPLTGKPNKTTLRWVADVRLESQRSRQATSRSQVSTLVKMTLPPPN